MTRPVSAIFYGGFTIIIIGILSPLWLNAFKPLEELPQLGRAPSFSGQDSTASEFSSEVLAGKNWVVTFFFSHCQSTCPKQNATMGRLAAHFSAEAPVRFLSITVDPASDTPEVLAEYAQKLGAQPAQWHFLRLSQAELDRVLTEGFKLGSGGKPEYHSPRMILVDAAGMIRGYYDGTDDKDAERLVTNLRQLF